MRASAEGKGGRGEEMLSPRSHGAHRQGSCHEAGRGEEMLSPRSRGAHRQGSCHEAGGGQPPLAGMEVLAWLDVERINITHTATGASLRKDVGEMAVHRKDDKFSTLARSSSNFRLRGLDVSLGAHTKGMGVG